MSERQSREICEGVNFLCINDKKFKTSRLSFTMFLPLDRNTVTKNAILSAVLDRSCKKYPRFSSFNRRLEELYGANLYSSVGKMGEMQLITVSAVCINDNVSYDKSSIISDVTELLCEIMFNPCVENGKFRDEDINQAKRQVIENIKSEYNDKKLYAKLRCEEIMCKNEKFGINKYGYEDDVNSITPEDIFNSWKNALESSKIEIISSGSVDFDTIYKMFSDRFKNINRKNVINNNTVIIEKADKVTEYEDCMDVSQCKLVMGFRTPYSDLSGDVFPMKLMSALLGGTPNSKLFLNVREELSLCYYCASNYNKNKGIMLIESGVERKNLDMAKEEILKQLEAIKNGDFTDDEIMATKLYLMQSFEKFQDSLSSIEVWYVSQVFSKKKMTPEEAARAVNGVTRQQIIEAANNVSLDTIYTLVGKENDENEA